MQSTGNQATAHVVFEDPPVESDVLLEREGGTWRLAQLPAFVERGVQGHGSEPEGGEKPRNFRPFGRTAVLFPAISLTAF